MSEIIFVIKTALIAAAMIFALQVQVGKGSLEQSTLKFLRDSKAVDTLRSVARGALKFMGRGYDSGADLLKKRINEETSQFDESPASR